MGNAYDYAFAWLKPSDIYIPNIPVVGVYGRIYHHKKIVPSPSSTVILEMETENSKRLLRFHYTFIDMMRDVIVSVDYRDLGGDVIERMVSVMKSGKLWFYVKDPIHVSLANPFLRQIDVVYGDALPR